ncbi:MAG: methylenetetrahydrofolate reductase [NAD(P)H] [Acetivibrionales bacterium]|nr:methylenetetrahydrofolate reductase [NAD(P)H] [Bacillota bacterium]NLP07169.1 methylenetetrahydrofolate reductase [NAD(P)H] [Clostridiaceae bacterium]HOA54447.1 methylenetetrahydrofolate reductase [NAD(P)H] [Clostridiales bacterium]HQD30426.1 methylenetetrahydrofolate reductase [NAD(P)H] [Clostridiales bacterium]
MKIIDMFNKKRPVISFEIFPPRPDVPLDRIYDQLESFEALSPDYISVTYGAGGSRKGRTLEIASRIKKLHNIESMAHFTCVGHTKEEIDNMLKAMHESGLENILALRGDPPADQPDFDFGRSAYKYAYELIQHIRRVNDFCVAAAAYVEGHVDSRRLSEDLAHLKEKVDTGVDFLITQLFFDNRLFFDFIEKARAKGIECPVAAGIMPIFKADQIKSIALKSGCSIPARVVLMMDKYQNDPEDMRKAGIEYASYQIRELIGEGVDGIHLYTMNRPKSTREIMDNISDLL